MQIVHVATSELAGMAAPYNPRKISDHDLDRLRRSLKFFGTVEPIVVNRRSRHIVGGHQRVRAAEAEGIDSLPVVYVNLDDPSFWLRKAIGWALRQYARTDPDWVLRAVDRYGDRLSGLSRREATKHL